MVWTPSGRRVAFVAIGVYEATLERDSSFHLAQFTMRLGYFSIAALLLAYLARQQHRLHVDLERLATWPDAGTDDEPAFSRRRWDMWGEWSLSCASC